VSADARGWRMALVPEDLVNPSASVALPDVMAILAECGYGVLQLPPPGKHDLLLAVIADQVAEYAHHGYAVAAIGVHGTPDVLHWRRLAPLLRHRGAPLPARHLLRQGIDATKQGSQLAAFLSAYDLPEAEQRRWRV
jgi:hypothetical protein